jgi:hypothetical protein
MKHSSMSVDSRMYYIHVVGEVTDYYGVHKIMTFDIRPVSSGNEVTNHFLEVAYSFEKTMNMWKMKC